MKTMRTVDQLLRMRSKAPTLESLGMWLSSVDTTCSDEEIYDSHLRYILQKAARASPLMRRRLEELGELHRRMGEETDLLHVGKSAAILHRALEKHGEMEPEDLATVERWADLPPELARMASAWIEEGRGDAEALETVIRQTEEVSARRRERDERSGRKWKEDQSKRTAAVQRMRRLDDVCEAISTHVFTDPEDAAQMMLQVVGDLLALLLHADAAVEVDEPEDARRHLRRALLSIQVLRAGIEAFWTRSGLRGSLPDPRSI